jgi:hypothetical protein
MQVYIFSTKAHGYFVVLARNEADALKGCHQYIKDREDPFGGHCSIHVNDIDKVPLFLNEGEAYFIETG